MDRIVCSAKKCFHNMAGACFADMVFVDEYVDEYGGMPYCRSFESQRPSGYAGTDKKIAVSGDICCAIRNCIYNKDRFCTADYIKISGQDQGNLCWCLRYQKK